MKTTLKILAVFVVGVVVGAGFVFLAPHLPLKINDQDLGQPIATVSYSCDGLKTISAEYYLGTSTSALGADQPVVPGGSVDVSLSDGRELILPQTISADGARYANADESFVFWNKGNSVMILEDGKESTFTNCVSSGL